MRLHTHIALLLLVLLGITHNAFADEAISIQAGGILLSPSGKMAGGNPATASRIDMANTLGFKRKTDISAQAAIQLGDSRLGFSYLPLNFTGSSTMTTPVNFNGTAFTGAVQSSLKATIFDASYTWYVINMDDLPSRLQFGIETSVKYINTRISMQSALSNQSLSASVAIPMAGIRGRIALADFIGLSGHMGYMGYANNRLVDYEAQLEYSPLPTLGMYAGYRSLQLKLESGSTQLDTRFSGPFVGLFARF